MSGSRLRLASFNILHGRSLAAGPMSPDLLADACASTGADVLCLQEVDRGQPRSGSVDQTAAIARRMGATDWRFEPALVGEPGGRWHAATEGDGDLDGPAPAEPGYGVAVVSRVPVRTWHVVRLAAAPVRSPVVVPGGRGRFVLLPDEPRVALAAVVDGPRGPMAVVCTHLSFVPGWNARQLTLLLREVASLAPGVVVAGDLNLPGPPVRLLARSMGWLPLVRAVTFPAGRPWLQIDHALARGDVGSVAAWSTPLLPVSDHLAMVVDLAAADGKGRAAK